MWPSLLLYRCTFKGTRLQKGTAASCNYTCPHPQELSYALTDVPPQSRADHCFSTQSDTNHHPQHTYAPTYIMTSYSCDVRGIRAPESGTVNVKSLLWNSEVHFWTQVYLCSVFLHYKRICFCLATFVKNNCSKIPGKSRIKVPKIFPLLQNVFLKDIRGICNKGIYRGVWFMIIYLILYLYLGTFL